MFDIHKISVAYDLTHVQLLIQKVNLTEELIHEYFAQCRYHSSHFVHTLSINEY